MELAVTRADVFQFRWAAGNASRGQSRDRFPFHSAGPGVTYLVLLRK